MVRMNLRRSGLLSGLSLAALCFSTGTLSAQVVAAAATGNPASPQASATPTRVAAAHAGDREPGSSLKGDSARTRFVIGLDRVSTFQVFALANPSRVVVELPDVKLQLPPAPAEGQSVGLVKSFRGGLSAPGRSRIVIDVTSPVVVENARIEKGKDGKSPHLAIEIVPVDAALKPAARKPLKTAPSGLGASGVQPPSPRPAQRPELRAAKAFKPIIVIDPGHGGHDSGAQKFGTVEKEVVLAFSKSLREKLEATGRYKVLMTRDTDKFIDLDERRAFAERNKANLFIAVHADYAGTKARGATIYSLRDSVANELKRSAKDDAGDHVLNPTEVNAVKAASGDVDAVKSILSDLVRREVDATKERTSVFTRSVIENMGASTNLRDDPDKQAAFRVLKTAQFPSVLIELAYVSNRQDALNLKSDTWRDKVSESIVTAVENYFSHQVARLPM